MSQDQAANRRRSEAIQRFAARYDAIAVLRRQADDWQEGFSASTDMTHTIGRSSGDRVSSTVVGPYPSTDKEDEGKVELIEGHGLAERCSRQANALEQWLKAGDRTDNETFDLLPSDHPIAEMRARHANPRNNGAGICERCGRNVPGIRESSLLNIEADRLKNGYCYGQPPHCYNSWIAANRPPRIEFNRSLQPETGTEETPASATNHECGGTTTSRSAEVRP